MSDHRPVAEQEQLRTLPIAVRPRHGETVESYIRRLAHANHLRPSYLRRYLAGRPTWLSAVRPERLVALSGRTADTLTRALTDFHVEKHRPQRTDRLRRRHSEKPALYRAIRATLAAEPDISVHGLCKRFRVGARTVALAVASPEPPPWKPPNKTSLLALPALIDELLDAHPQRLGPAHLGTHPRHHRHRGLLRQRHPRRQTTAEQAVSDRRDPGSPRQRESASAGSPPRRRR
ncbi:TniQ family protein [Dactylosporangium sp. CA-233914]|uniref:TniQ family protein n=1 Tax=Dactylosporangium sp. CA-233914 TaxID=3239934 RepID=UPI003D8BC0F7